MTVYGWPLSEIALQYKPSMLTSMCWVAQTSSLAHPLSLSAKNSSNTWEPISSHLSMPSPRARCNQDTNNSTCLSCLGGMHIGSLHRGHLYGGPAPHSLSLSNIESMHCKQMVCPHSINLMWWAQYVEDQNASQNIRIGDMWVNIKLKTQRAIKFPLKSPLQRF